MKIIIENEKPVFINKYGDIISQGNGLRSLQKKNNWTNPGMAKMLGVTPDTIVRWKKGSRPISKTAMLLLLRITADS